MDDGHETRLNAKHGGNVKVVKVKDDAIMVSCADGVNVAVVTLCKDECEKLYQFFKELMD